jgi:hypothetical protein
MEIFLGGRATHLMQCFASSLFSLPDAVWTYGRRTTGVDFSMGSEVLTAALRAVLPA